MLVSAHQADPVLRMVADALQLDSVVLFHLTGTDAVVAAVHGAHADPATSRPGMRTSRDGSAAQLLADGKIPATIPDVSACRAAADVGVGCFVGTVVPVDDEEPWVLCGFARQSRRHIPPADVRFLAAVGEMLAGLAGAGTDTVIDIDRLQRAVRGQDVSIVFQPIMDLASGEPAGFEALSRFGSEPAVSPDVWFAAAASAGVGFDLEIGCVEAAVAAAAELPEGYLSVNVSPQTLCRPELVDAVSGGDRPVVVEITEHVTILGMCDVVEAREELAAAGVQVALDDAGTGYSGMSVIADLRPDIVKLDRHIIRDVDVDDGRRAIVDAAARLAESTGTTLVAEGVETVAELATLVDLDCPAAQGYLLARPMPAAAVTAMFSRPAPGPARFSLVENAVSVPSS